MEKPGEGDCIPFGLLKVAGCYRKGLQEANEQQDDVFT